MFAREEDRTKIKICGITNLQDSRFVAGALADYIGFIFYEKSPRYIEPAQAGAIINWLEGPRPVGVFVNEDIENVNETAVQTGIELVQLHGNESPEYCSSIDKPVIKVVHVNNDTTPHDIEQQVADYLPHIEHILFDTKTDKLWGGTGKTFNWDLLKELTDEIPFFLSGGLNSQNVRQACQTVHPYAVDVSSGVEKEPGKKDFSKLNDFFEEMREVQSLQEMGNL